MSSARRQKRQFLGALLITAMTAVLSAGAGSIAHGQDAPVEGKAELPTAETVYDAFFEAIGGKETVENLETAYTRLRVDAGGQVVPFRTRWHRDGPFLIEYELPNGTNRAGSNGEVAWTYTPTRGYELMAKQTAKTVHNQFNFSTMLLTLAEQFDAMRVLSAESFHGRPAYRVALDGTGVSSRTAYFDRETGLVLGMTWSETSPIGDNQYEIRFSEWKEFGDVRMWTKLELVSTVHSQTVTIDELEFNRMEPGVFALPDQVKKLAAESPAPEPELPSPPVKIEDRIHN